MSSSSDFNSGIRDNYNRGTMGDFLQEKIIRNSKLSIVSAYFTIYAFNKLKEKLSQIDKLSFLFGEPRFVTSLDPEKTDAKSFNIEESGLQLQNRLEQKRIAKDCSEWIKNKVEIKSIQRSNLLHGKMYHIANGQMTEAILGSSNFTVAGLGLGDQHNNIELNLIVNDRRDLTDLKLWFDEIWSNDELVEDVKESVLRYLEKLYTNNSPELIYFKTLYHIFDKYLEEQESDLLLEKSNLIIDSQVWQTLFDFQRDGVKAAINKIFNHNGCIIADSVGLGKTYEALAIIKYFELLNYNILVLCPKKLRGNWTIYQASVNSTLNPFPKDRFNYTVLSHTDLSRESGNSGDIDLATFNWGNFDLIVIDESHNFRNNTKGKRDEQGKRIRKSRYERLMEDIIQSGVRTRVLLLSATPVNNDLRDLRNQIYFLTEGEDNAYSTTLGINSIEGLLRGAQLTFNDWARKSEERDTRELLERLSSGFFKLLDGLTIARSRKHIEKYYKDELERLGGFPERLKPISIYSEIDLKDKFISYDSLNDRIEEYKLSLFTPSFYVKEDSIKKYELDQTPQFTQKQREGFLIGMMKVGFLKRLESSIHSFTLTMERTLQKIDDVRNLIYEFKEHQENIQIDNEDLEINELEIEDEDIRDAFQVGKKLVFDLTDLNVDCWLKDLDHDYEKINSIFEQAEKISVERDAKLTKLKELIADKVKNPPLVNGIHPETKEPFEKENKKVLVFTAFADTASYLYENLFEWAREELNIHIAMVTGGTKSDKASLGLAKYDHILTNFSPLAKTRWKIKDENMPNKEEIDLLIATDCISEGQNLQDCDYMINYDIHWNPVRIIQRFGRIDRIGSQNKAIQLINFWPTKDLEKYITLQTRVEARMALVDVSATGADDLLNPDEIRDIIVDDISFRDKQLLRLQDEVLDLEDFNESVALNEFTLDDFRIELSRYIEANRKILESTPLGLYSIVPINPEYPSIRPGVIFCLRQKGVTESTVVNPLQPYFLVYIHNDGNVRFSFAQPKQILETLRALCVGKGKPYEKLNDLFDNITNNGANMEEYSKLLNNAVTSISRTFTRRAARSLSASRDAVLIASENQITDSTDFDLITWVVIANES